MAYTQSSQMPAVSGKSGKKEAVSEDFWFHFGIFALVVLIASPFVFSYINSEDEVEATAPAAEVPKILESATEANIVAEAKALDGTEQLEDQIPLRAKLETTSKEPVTNAPLTVVAVVNDTEEVLKSMAVSGVMIRGAKSKITINSETFRVGDVVTHNPVLIFDGIDNNRRAAIFRDESESQHFLPLDI